MRQYRTPPARFLASSSNHLVNRIYYGGEVSGQSLCKTIWWAELKQLFMWLNVHFLFRFGMIFYGRWQEFSPMKYGGVAGSSLFEPTIRWEETEMAIFISDFTAAVG